MILKSFELTKIKPNNYKFYLFYADNEGLKEENIKNLFEKNYQDKIYRYEEKEILDNINTFFNSVLTKSFFDNEKLIVINRVSDKIREIIEDLIEKKNRRHSIYFKFKKSRKKINFTKTFRKTKINCMYPIL